MTAHTPATLRMLERVAAASQSGRVVLLEGETCSGKTQLVVELARLAQVSGRGIQLDARLRGEMHR
jgi:tRNA A37 threonylcarbamoyladenosine biosynthesis protein TsaE